MKYISYETLGDANLTDVAERGPDPAGHRHPGCVL